MRLKLSIALLTDQAKSVWSLSVSVFIFLTNCMHHFYSYILQKTPLKLVNWFQRYEHLKDAKNKRKQKTFSALFGSILKSIFLTSDWFCSITSQICKVRCLQKFKQYQEHQALCKIKEKIIFIFLGKNKFKLKALFIQTCKKQVVQFSCILYRNSLEMQESVYTLKCRLDLRGEKILK